ncbi:MAG: phosphoribosyltransferase family protein [Halieaceae bacterium]|jgi:hypoxanthine phosphoribosyltransferase|nr:phosphoribosyltransferase family protein [Halieaceae bacterium]
MGNVTDRKQYITEESLLLDGYRLAVQIFESGFRPDFIAAVWRGGATVGIYVQECLQYLGVETDHIAIRTSYRGVDDYLQRIDSPEGIRVHGLQYLFENLNRDNPLLIVDDVFSSGHNIEAVLNRLKAKAKRNTPGDIRIAVPYFKPQHNRTGRTPDYYLHQTDDWLVLPYELTGLSVEELREHKPWILPILEDCKPKI